MYSPRGAACPGNRAVLMLSLHDVDRIVCSRRGPVWGPAVEEVARVCVKGVTLGGGEARRLQPHLHGRSASGRPATKSACAGWGFLLTRAGGFRGAQRHSGATSVAGPPPPA